MNLKLKSLQEKAQWNLEKDIWFSLCLFCLWDAVQPQKDAQNKLIVRQPTHDYKYQTQILSGHANSYQIATC